MTPDAGLLHTRDDRGVHSLTLNTPRSFNVLSEAMLIALQAAIDAVAADPKARLVVIGASGKAFCAGHDLKEMKANPELTYYQALFARCSRLMLAIRKLEVPVIARVQGLATAAGCQLVAQCDLAVASDNASFGVNGIDVGLFCATPGVALSRNILPKQAMEMLLTGDFISAAEARDRGLVNRVVAPDALDAEVATLVDRILAKPPEAIAMGKALFYSQLETGMEAAYQLAGQTMACNMAHPVAQEGVQAFIDKRAPGWRA
ncbi:enoyl-CoA hydratase [Hydrogenophaga sp.]|uniref:enoyl-CoA hydratase n=1 Tax=Hydrogenophaga sp. TaxID=1904254 RepID=UPI00272FB60C|nr:enoyl-CoA hydratase [Hydrogenophaga sp.]MDP2075197.1 enoyl-CoA hydratase [Hydrogenophaga sp.]MDP3109942.1 enoyl-CoA hydratase [Hydrogenophaga sp.]MDZ4396362.1 enoyl-CoA hydratase [Hydrogenophaga sp.]